MAIFFYICKSQFFAKSTFVRVEKTASGSCDTQWSNIMAMCFCISTRSSDECSMFPRVRKKLLLFKKTFEVLLLEAKILSFIDENKLRPMHFKFVENNSKTVKELEAQPGWVSPTSFSIPFRLPVQF